MAVDHSLQIDLAGALERTDEGIDGDEASGVRRFDMTLAELRREPLHQSNLFIGKGELTFCRLPARRRSRTKSRRNDPAKSTRANKLPEPLQQSGTVSRLPSLYKLLDQVPAKYN